MTYSNNPDLVLVAVGANLPIGDQLIENNINSAVSRVFDYLGSKGGISFLYRSKAVPKGSGPDYVNACFALRCRRDPGEILALMHHIESDFHRTRGARWAARTLDLDLLAVGDLVLPDLPVWRRWQGLSLAQQRVQTPGRLILPHPRIQDRAFVLKPLCDIAPGWRHPVLGLEARQMLQALPKAARDEVQRLKA